MGWFGRLIGTEKAVDSLLDTEKGLLVRAGGWFDGLSHTQQEKAEDRQKTREWGVRQLEALAPFKVTQRIIAMTTMGFWVICGLNMLAAIWFDALTDSNVTAAMVQFVVSDYVLWPTFAVLGLYMGGGVWPNRKGAS